ncbi:survival motor neuron protein-like [Saccoglossus kowalevskii]|uniref:Survival motor neuron protein-like n=1 Tax=Saccoglossus kowalevskii TaxID=10224 RepID=A0ABM0GMI8_SACKO|nr:PREDICTED: survival motor neuron protein-like [Saccoglossus kowalevskii]
MLTRRSNMAASSEGVVFRNDKSEESDIWDDEALIKAYDKAVKAVKDEIINDSSKDIQSNPDTGCEKRIRKKKSNRDKKLRKKKIKSKWHVGDRCRAVYSEDGIIYDAVIKSIDRDNNRCWILYTGYGNEEEIDINDLLHPEYEVDSRHDNLQENGYDSHQSMDCNEFGQSPAHPTSTWHNYPGNSRFSHPPPPPPRIPPHFNPMNPVNNPYYNFFPTGYQTMHPWFGAAMHPGSTPPRIPPIPPPPPITQDATAGDEDALFSMLISWYMSGYHTGYYQGLKASRGESLQNTPQRNESPVPTTSRQEHQQGEHSFTSPAAR